MKLDWVVEGFQLEKNFAILLVGLIFYCSTQLSVIVRENRAGPKDRGQPFTFIFSQYKTYPKRSTTMIFAEVGVCFSSRYHYIVILASQVVQNGRNFRQL